MAALSPDQARLALVTVTGAAVTEASRLVTQDAAQTRQALFDVLPATIAYYSDGSSALAADYYDDLREDASAAGRFRADPVVNLRWGSPSEEKIRSGILWAVKPLLDEVPNLLLTQSRVGEVIQLETARPFHDTLLTSRRRDPSAMGWQRVASASACKFCRFLAGRGEVYRESSARFASHPTCGCTARPVFHGQPGDEVGVLQYVASKRRASRTPKQRQAINDALAAMDGGTVLKSAGRTGAKPATAKPAVTGFNAMSRSQVQKQIQILEGTKASEYRTTQLARLRARIASMD